MAKIKTTSEGIVWIGNTTSGVIKRKNGGLLFKIRFTNSEKELVNCSLQVHEKLTKPQARKQWTEWTELKKSELYDVKHVQHREATPTFKQLGVENGPWWEIAKASYYTSPASFKKVAVKVKDLVENPRFNEFANSKIDEITLNDCQKLLDKLKNKYHKSLEVLRRYKQAVSSVFRYATEHGLALTNPNYSARIETATERQARLSNHKIVALDANEELKAIKLIDQDKRLERRVLLKVALRTGMRIGEITGLTWDEIHLEKNPYIYLEHELQESPAGEYEHQRQYVAHRTKNGRSRIVPISKDLKHDLKLLKDETTHKKWKMDNGEEYDFLFCHVGSKCSKGQDEGQCYSIATPRRWWEAYNEQLIDEGKVKQRITFHKLRATALTSFAHNENLTIDDVRRIAGHSDSAVTLKYYVYESDEHMKQLGAMM